MQRNNYRLDVKVGACNDEYEIFGGNIQSQLVSILQGYISTGKRKHLILKDGKGIVNTGSYLEGEDIFLTVDELCEEVCDVESTRHIKVSEV